MSMTSAVPTRAAAASAAETERAAAPARGPKAHTDLLALWTAPSGHPLIGSEGSEIREAATFYGVEGRVKGEALSSLLRRGALTRARSIPASVERELNQRAEGFRKSTLAALANKAKQ